MKYPGNETLAEEIRGRIINTFRQTLDLAESGSLTEARLGCEFVLRLDPMFGPARTLEGRIETAKGAPEVADLREAVGITQEAVTKATATAAGPAEPAPGAAAQNVSKSPAGPDPFATPPSARDTSEPALAPRRDDSASTLESALDLSALEPATASPPPAQPGPSEPVAALDTESEARVRDLLSEGQDAFDNGEYQSAIDAWSRIFLIDIDHPEANRRIDLARKLKAEVERKLEETYHDAISNVEKGQLDQARRGFAAVLEIMPGHVAAQEYLARLDAPDFAVPEPVALSPDHAGIEQALGESLASDGFSDASFDALDTEILTPPDPSQAAGRPAVGGVGKASKPARSSNQTFKIIGAAALVLLAVVGWFLYRNWTSIFPNASDAPPTVQLDPITRAKRTHAEAGAAIAIAQLRRLSPGHPQYAEAQALVAQWEATLDASNPDKREPEPEALAARDRFADSARAAFAEGQFLEAQEFLEQAASNAPLGEAEAAMLEEVTEELAPIQTEVAMVREGEWELALRNLWRMREGGSDNPDVRRLMIDSYFNLGVRDLQRSDPESALGNFREALELTESDAELERLIRFARTYESRPEDLLYRIFVKYQPFR